MATPTSSDRPLRNTHAQEYSYQLWDLLAAFIFLLSAFNLIRIVYFKLYRFQSSSPSRAGFSWRRAPLALLNAARIVAFRWTLKIGESYTLNAAEVVLTVAYIIALFTWTFVNTTNVVGKKLDPTYWRNRAGVIATGQLPLIAALGTKHNIVSLLTGIGYEKLSYLHRMTARVTFVLLWIHAAGYIRFNGIKPGEWSESWLRLGVVAASALAILCLFSIRPIRAKQYEFFFYLHMVMILTFLVGTYYHVRDFEQFIPYVYPTFIVWGLDRLLRLVRLVLFNHSYFGFSSGTTLDARPELLSEDLVRLTLRRPPHFRWSAAQTAYLILPSVSTLPFEAHPFTIASIDPESHNKPDEVDQEKGLEKAEGAAESYWKELVFLINVREGFTKRLLDIASRNEMVKAFLDGPYGSTPDLCRSDTCVLVAGGSGISHTLPLFLQIVNDVERGKSRCDRLVFVWAIRDARHIRWLSQPLNRAIRIARSSLNIVIRIHVTSGVLNNIDWSGSESTLAQCSLEGAKTRDAHISEAAKRSPIPSILDSPVVEVVEGRPDLEAILSEEARMAKEEMSVCACGPDSMVRATRDALQFSVSGPTIVLNGGANVVLHVESFGKI